MIAYDDQLMYRIAEYMQNRLITVVLNNSTEITGRLDALMHPVRNINTIILNNMTKNKEIENISELPRLKNYGNPPLTLSDSKLKCKESCIKVSKIFIRSYHINLMYNIDNDISTRNESERLSNYIIQHPGNVVKNKAFIKCQQIGCNN